MVKTRVVMSISRLLGLNESDIKPDAELESGLGMDSLDKIELVMSLEEEFEIELADADVERCQTVSDVVGLVERVAA